MGNVSLQWDLSFLKSLFLQEIQKISRVLLSGCGCPTPGSAQGLLLSQTITGGIFSFWESWGSRKSTLTGLLPLQGVETVKKEIDESVLGQTGPYRRPERLRKRTEYSGERIKEQRVFEANEYVWGPPGGYFQV